MPPGAESRKSSEAYECLKDPQKRLRDPSAMPRSRMAAVRGGRFRWRLWRRRLLRHFRRHLWRDDGWRAPPPPAARAWGGPALQHGNHAGRSLRGQNSADRVPSSISCAECSGSGAKPGTQPATCQLCGGHGKVRQAQGFFHRAHLSAVPGAWPDGEGSMSEMPARGASRNARFR
jgi:molecular chaperone DnaJ